MSYETWHTYGYGICVSDITECTVDRLQNLLSLAPKFQDEIQSWLEECEIIEPSCQLPLTEVRSFSWCGSK